MATAKRSERVRALRDEVLADDVRDALRHDDRTHGLEVEAAVRGAWRTCPVACLARRSGASLWLPHEVAVDTDTVFATLEPVKGGCRAADAGTLARFFD